MKFLPASREVPAYLHGDIHTSKASLTQVLFEETETGPCEKRRVSSRIARDGLPLASELTVEHHQRAVEINIKIF